jgi:hypothetical protein
MSRDRLTKEDVLKTKELLKNEGSWVIVREDNTVCRCLGGALAEVLTGDAHNIYAADADLPALRDFFERATPIRQRAERMNRTFTLETRVSGQFIYYFNDDAKTTYGDVIAVLDEVAATFESE